MSSGQEKSISIQRVFQVLDGCTDHIVDQESECQNNDECSNNEISFYSDINEVNNTVSSQSSQDTINTDDLENISFSAATAESTLAINSNTRLYRLLKGSTAGELILKAKPTPAGFLTPKARSRLTRFIIKIETDKAVRNAKGSLTNFSLDGKDFLGWAEEIVNTFPGENKDTYYIPYGKGSKKRADNARGKLLYHLEYIKGVLTEDGVIVKPDSHEPTCLPDAQIDQLVDLQSKTSPWVEVVSLWRETYEARKSTLKKGITVECYLNTYPCFSLQSGLQLLEINFDLQFPGKSCLFKENWPKARNYLIQRLQATRITDPNHNGYARLLPTLSRGIYEVSEQTSKHIFFSDLQYIVILYLLPYLGDPGKSFNPRKRKHPNVENVDINQQEITNVLKVKRPTFQERQDGFFVHLESAATIKEIILQGKKDRSH